MLIGSPSLCIPAAPGRCKPHSVLGVSRAAATPTQCASKGESEVKLGFMPNGGASGWAPLRPRGLPLRANPFCFTHLHTHRPYWFMYVNRALLQAGPPPTSVGPLQSAVWSFCSHTSAPWWAHTFLSPVQTLDPLFFGRLWPILRRPKCTLLHYHSEISDYLASCPCISPSSGPLQHSSSKPEASPSNFVLGRDPTGRPLRS